MYAALNEMWLTSSRHLLCEKCKCRVRQRQRLYFAYMCASKGEAIDQFTLIPYERPLGLANTVGAYASDLKLVRGLPSHGDLDAVPPDGALQLVARHLRDEPPVPEDAHVIRQALEFVNLVGRDQNGGGRIGKVLGQQRQRAAAYHRVKAVRRLVQKENGRAMGQRQHELQPSALAFR